MIGYLRVESAHATRSFGGKDYVRHSCEGYCDSTSHCMSRTMECFVSVNLNNKGHRWHCQRNIKFGWKKVESKYHKSALEHALSLSQMSWHISSSTILEYSTPHRISKDVLRVEKDCFYFRIGRENIQHHIIIMCAGTSTDNIDGHLRCRDPHLRRTTLHTVLSVGYYEAECACCCHQWQLAFPQLYQENS